MRHFCVDVDATKTAKLLGMNRKTVNRWFTLFRLAVYWHRVNMLDRIVGEAEVDESYFGARRKRGFSGRLKRGRGTQRQPVFGIFERDGEVLTEIVPNCRKAALQPVILGKVDKEAVMCSDGWRGYDGLVDMGYDRHFRVNHSRHELSRSGGVHINGIESFWSFTKRRLSKFSGVKRNFDLHLKECEWRRKKGDEQLQKDLWKIFGAYDRI